MAKPLVFQLGDNEIAFDLEKVDRSKLYGYKEVEVLDDHEGRCELATLAADGQTVIGRGGSGLGYLSAAGEWCDKAQLQPIDLDGNPIVPVPSSYAAPVKLFDTVTPDDYLSHTIRSVYLLTTENNIDDLLTELKRGTIFTFPYSFRGGLEADVGFMLQGDDGNIFLTIGDPTRMEYIGVEASVPPADDTEDEDGTDSMDFDLL